VQEVVQNAATSGEKKQHQNYHFRVLCTIMLTISKARCYY